jgi:hypothetical protein
MLASYVVNPYCLPISLSATPRRGAMSAKLMKHSTTLQFKKDLSLRSLRRLDPLTLNGSNYFFVESVITFVESTLVESVDVAVVVVLLHAANKPATARTKIAFFICSVFVYN